MKKSGKDRLKSTINESTLSTADAVPLPQWGRLRYEDAAIPDTQPSPRGEGAPKGRIGHWRYERERGGSSQVGDIREHPIHRCAVPLPQWGRLRYESTAIPETKPSPRGEGGERSEPDRVLAV